jgi:CubicO group peptidase (beta-lactamase class C family)
MAMATRMRSLHVVDPKYPGTHFFYNNWDFNALGTAFEKLTGKNIYDVLRDDLALPLQMQDFNRERQKAAGEPFKPFCIRLDDGDSSKKRLRMHRYTPVRTLASVPFLGHLSSRSFLDCED